MQGVCVRLFLYINCTAIVHTTQCCRGIETNSDTALYICGSTFSLTPQPHNDRQMWSQTWGGSNLQPDLNSSSLLASFTLPFQIVIPLPTTVTIFSAAANSCPNTNALMTPQFWPIRERHLFAERGRVGCTSSGRG